MSKVAEYKKLDKEFQKWLSQSPENPQDELVRWNEKWVKIDHLNKLWDQLSKKEREQIVGKVEERSSGVYHLPGNP